MTLKADANQLIRDLAEYWEGGVVPELVLRRPAMAPDFVRERLEALRTLLSEAEYANLRKKIYEVASATTTEVHRQAVEAERRAEAAQRAREEHDRARVEALRGPLYEALATDFLAVDDIAVGALGTPEDYAVLSQLRCDYVREWCEGRGLELSDEQAAAVGAVHGHTLVRARAGSGKTHTVVARTRFLREHCGVAPDELLILAFNRSAVVDIQRKLRESGGVVPHVRTFHALAYQIVRPTEAILDDDDREGVFRDIALDRFDDPELGPEVRHLMLERFREDWHSLIEQGLHLSPTEGLALRRAMPLLTLGGQRVKSHGEQVIANYLFEHDVPYRYEEAHRWGERTYRPDFTIRLPEQMIVIEYFGMVGEAEYDRQSAAKREYWDGRADCTLIELFPSDIAAGPTAIEALLRARLTELGVRCTPLPEDVIWDRVRERARSQFARMVRSFIGRCRKERLTPSTLAARLSAYRTESGVERRFLGIAAQLYADYIDRLRQTGSDDFDGLLERAVQRVENGASVFDGSQGQGDLRRLRFAMVDEFQDFAPLYHDLLQAVLRLNPRLQLFCVGDDWQAINAFAGATTRYFDDFGSYFAPARTLGLSTNRRSGRRIVDAGNRVMDGVGSGGAARAREDAPPGRVLIADLTRFTPTDAERARFGTDFLTPAVRRILAQRLLLEGRIALLARTNDAPRGRPAARERRGLERWADDVCLGLTDHQRMRVDVCTAHKYKGRDAEIVVVVDAIDRKYPHVHPDWVFTRALGDTLEKLVEDERRLFYVACTRAKQELVLVIDGNVSPFAAALGGGMVPINWADFPSRSDHGTAWVVRVTGRNGAVYNATYQVREELKAHHFKYRGGSERYWVRTFAQSEQLQLEDVVAALQRDTWSVLGDRLKVHIEDGFGTVHGVYGVSRGTWSPLTVDGQLARRRS